MAEIQWNNGIGSRGRRSWLLLVRGDEVVIFAGVTIPGLVVVRGHDFEKNGKWSNTTYRLEVARGVRTLSGRDGWETGRFTEGLAAVTGHSPIDTWVDVAQALSIGVPSAMAFLRGWRPREAQSLDQVDRDLEALDAVAEAAGVDAENETVVVSFGGPTRRAMAEGFWESPKGIPGYPEGRVELLDPSKGWIEGNVSVTGVIGMVTSVVHSRGYHGGYISVTVVVAGKSKPPSRRIMLAEMVEMAEVVQSPLSSPASKESETSVDLTKVDLSGLFGGAARRK